MINKGLFSSNTGEWETPQDLYDILNKAWGFTLDVCATKDNAKCERFITKEQDALSENVFWHGTCWMNPPYGRGIGKWIEKAYLTAKSGNSVVCLVPARTDTSWWHDYCMKGDITFIRGRLKFGDSKNSAPFPSAIVVFSPITIHE